MRFGVWGEAPGEGGVENAKVSRKKWVRYSLDCFARARNDVELFSRKMKRATRGKAFPRQRLISGGQDGE